jgi:GT2 family glycosyltransferase
LPYPRGRNEIDTGQYDNDKDVFSGSGGASLYKALMLKDIGLFDEDFFAYYEDVDLSFRAQLAGWKIKYSPEAIVYHHVGATSVKMGHFAAYQTAKNIPLLYLKNMPLKLFFKYLPLALFWYTRMLAAHIIKGGRLAFIKGFFVMLYILPKKILERHKIQKTKKTSAGYIDQLLIHNRPPKLPKEVK